MLAGCRVVAFGLAQPPERAFAERLPVFPQLVVRRILAAPTPAPHAAEPTDEFSPPGQSINARGPDHGSATLLSPNPDPRPALNAVV